MDNYVWNRNNITDNVVLQTLFATDESQFFKPKDIIELITADDNIDYLTDLIIERSDPLRNGTIRDTTLIKAQINKYLTSWINMGKFDSLDTISNKNKKLSIYTTSPINMLDQYNKEFVNTFAEKIAPTNDITKVTIVVNPNGLYAQQNRIITINSKPIPFYERSIFKRLTDFKQDQCVDETQNFFYAMDKNPRITDSERKKRDVERNELNDYKQRVAPEYRMLPKY